MEFLQTVFLACSKPAKIASKFLTQCTWDYQDNFKSVYLFSSFCKNISRVQKAQNANQVTFTLLEAWACKKPLLLLFFARLFFVLLANVCLQTFLYARNLFVKKKVNRLEIVFIASVHYTTNHYGRDLKNVQSAFPETILFYPHHITSRLHVLYVIIWNPAFCLALYNWRTFSSQFTARWWC